MTLIIGSLFLPYTVQFEVDPHGGEDGYSESALSSSNSVANVIQPIPTPQQQQPQPLVAQASPAQIQRHPQTQRQASFSGPTPGTPSGQPVSILPSLSIANSKAQTPISSSPNTNLDGSGKFADASSIDAQDFFYKNHKFKRGLFEGHASSVLSDNASDKLGPHYIQPRSRYSNLNLSSSVLDPKKEHDDLPPSLKINRSTSNLSGLSGTLASNSGSHTNLSNLSSSNPTAVRTRSSLSKPFSGLTLQSNSSTNSLVIAEEEERPSMTSTTDWNNEYTSGETKLAPFGGFSNPDIKGSLFDRVNIFETADWDVVFCNKGNVSVTKAVKLSVENNIIKKRKWVGTISMPSDEVPDHVISDIAASLSKDYNCDAVFPNDITFQGHYTSFCKQILWPTFHYQIPDDPKSKAFEDHSWGHYQLLNQLVADKIVEVYQRENGDLDPEDPENMIWIHDYHLLLVPLMVRKKLPNAKIGLFLHVSFPSSEVFRCFAQRNDILKGMLGANSISFQTNEYVRHFTQTCNRLLLADVNDSGISYEGNFTLVSTTPVGINSDSLAKVVVSEGVQEWRQLIRERWPDQHLIVSRDKLDKLRGIKQKLLAYEKFLNSNPEFIDTTTLLQICIGSTQDSDYESEIMQIVARINSLPENISVSQPVVLLHKDIEFEQYVALQAEADVFIVSSMREGLNLTCHEFITATNEKKSPLILSEFTGSSPLLDCGGKGAISINPWDLKNFAEAIKYSLTLDPSEKLERWTNCSKIVRTHDSKNWVSQCLKSINDSWEMNKRRNSNNLISLTSEEYDQFYRKGNTGGTRLFFLNFETSAATLSIGNKSTATNTVAMGRSAYTEPSRLLSLLTKIFEDPQNQVYLISFLKRSDLDRLYRMYPNIGLIAENGGYIKLIGSKKWISIVDESETSSWIPQVTKLIQSKVERLPGSHCEVEDCTVRFHTGKSFFEDRERTLDAMGDCIQHVNEVFQNPDGVHASLIKNVVIVQQNQLALKALKFISAYYNQGRSGVNNEDLIKDFQIKGVYNSAPTTPVNGLRSEYKSLETVPVSPGKRSDYFPVQTPTNSSNSHLELGSIFVTGATTLIDETNYEFANSLKEKGQVDTVSTVAILSDDSEARTSANFGVNGINELLRVLSKSVKL